MTKVVRFESLVTNSFEIVEDLSLAGLPNIMINFL